MGLAASMLLDWVPASFGADLEGEVRYPERFPGPPATGWGAPVVLVVVLTVVIALCGVAALAPWRRGAPLRRVAAAVLPGAALLVLSLAVRAVLESGDEFRPHEAVTTGPLLGAAALLPAAAALIAGDRPARRTVAIGVAALLVLALVVHDDYGTARLNGHPRTVIIATLATTDRAVRPVRPNPSGLHGVTGALLAAGGVAALAAAIGAAGLSRPARVLRLAGLGLCAVAAVVATTVGLIDHHAAHGLERFPGTLLALAGLGLLAATLVRGTPRPSG